MRVDALFEVGRGHGLDLNKLHRSDAPSAVNFVSRTEKNNGVSARVEPRTGLPPAPAGTITVAFGGSMLATFLQPSPFYTSQNVAVLAPKRPMTDVELLWWAHCIRANRPLFNYGRHPHRTFHLLELPDVVPAWVREQQVPELAPPTGSLPSVDTSSWKPFRVDALFTVTKGKRENSRQLQPGTVPYIRGSRNNNGRVGLYALDARFPGSSISVAYNGSVGEAFYQPAPYCASDDVNVLEPVGFELTAHRALFVCALLRAEKFRYNYGRKWRIGPLRSTVLLLPAKPEGAVDWGWIDSFMAGLPYADAA